MLPDRKDRDNLIFLVVDDIPNIRMTIRNMLHNLGYANVTEADDGLKALIKLNSQKIDIAIVDWNMPNMNGIDLLRRMRSDRNLSDIPFIMISGEVGDDTIAEAAETEVDAYIIKPFVATTLEEKITQVLNRKKNPHPLDTCLRQAQAFTQSKQFSNAMGELKKAASLQMNDPRISFGLAELYKQMGLFEEAEKAYKKAIHLEQKFIKAHDGLADLYKITGDSKKRLAVLTEALNVSPRNASRQAGLGKLFLEQGMLEDAKRAFGTALKAEPNNAVVQNEMAEVLLANNMDKEATIYFQAAQKANPDDIHTYNRLGMALRKQGKFQDAIMEYKKAIQVAPDDENLYYNLGRAYLETGLKDDAKKQFKKALECNAAFDEAREVMATIED
jgi:Flp pilus assembly protein TadD